MHFLIFKAFEVLYIGSLFITKIAVMNLDLHGYLADHFKPMSIFMEVLNSTMLYNPGILQ